jgi:hypothetical protein
LSRAQFFWKGHVVPLVGLDVRIETTDSPSLAEGYGTLSLGWLDVSAGLLRLPLGIGRLTDDWDLPTVTRARYIPPYASAPGSKEAAAWTDGAVPGSKEAAAWTDGAVQLELSNPGPRLKMALGLRDAAARLDFGALPGVACGAYYLAPNPFYPSPTIGRGTPPTRSGTVYDLWGADSVWDLGAVKLIAEYQYGSIANLLIGSGVVGHALWDVGDQDQFALRYEHLNPFPDPTGNRATQRTAVAGWTRNLPYPGARFQLQISRDFPAEALPITGVAAALSVKR